MSSEQPSVYLSVTERNNREVQNVTAIRERRGLILPPVLSKSNDRYLWLEMMVMSNTTVGMGSILGVIIGYFNQSKELIVPGLAAVAITCVLEHIIDKKKATLLQTTE